METQAAVAQPEEDGGFLIHSSTQTLDGVQAAVSRALNIPANKIVTGPPTSPSSCPTGIDMDALVQLFV